MKRTLLLAFVFLFALVGIANAQVKAGLNELSLSGGIDVVAANGESNTSTTITLGYGHFLNHRIEIGGNASFVKLENVDATGLVGGFGAYHLASSPTSRVVPFLGASAAMGYGNEKDNPIVLGAFGGLKLFVANGAAILVQPFFQRYNFGEKQGGDYSNYGVATGVSLFF